MAHIKKSIEINAPLADVFTYFMNPENLPEIWPSMLEVSKVKMGAGGGFDWVYKMAGFRFHGHSEILEWEENRRVMSRSKKGILNTFTYSFEGMNGGCRVTVEVEYEIPNKVLSKLAEPIVRRINQHEATALLGNLKSRMELSLEGRAPKVTHTKEAPRPRA